MTSLKRLHREIHKLDPKVEPGSDTFNAAVVTLASAIVGPNIRRLAKLTKLPLAYVTTIGRRLRENGIWMGSKVACDWNDKESGAIEFWLDVCVAQGLLERKP
jgi:hypothetical protein